MIGELDRSAEIDAAVTRLFALLGVPTPREGNVILDFHEGLLRKARPTQVIAVQRREKPLAHGLR